METSLPAGAQVTGRVRVVGVVGLIDRPTGLIPKRSPSQGGCKPSEGELARGLSCPGGGGTLPAQIGRRRETAGPRGHRVPLMGPRWWAENGRVEVPWWVSRGRVEGGLDSEGTFAGPDIL